MFAWPWMTVCKLHASALRSVLTRRFVQGPDGKHVPKKEDGSLGCVQGGWTCSCIPAEQAMWCSWLELDRCNTYYDPRVRRHTPWICCITTFQWIHVLCRSSWNPVWEEQAISRAHRMGQKGPIQVIRYLAEGVALFSWMCTIINSVSVWVCHLNL